MSLFQAPADYYSMKTPPFPFLLLSFLPRIRCETSLENATSSSRSVLQQNRRKANSGYGRLLLIRYRTLTILGEIVSFSKLTFWERAAFLRVPFFLSFFFFRRSLTTLWFECSRKEYFMSSREYIRFGEYCELIIALWFIYSYYWTL